MGKATSERVSLTFISTGTVKIRQSMRNQPISRFIDQFVAIRRLRSFTDRKWSDPLPIGVFLISHPNGPILFDTGESPMCNDPGYLPIWSPVKMVSSVTITQQEGIVNQLRMHGVEPTDLQAVVLSHLHSDHAGGLENLVTEAPELPIYVNRKHWEIFGNGPFNAKVQGCTPQHWPKNFKPELMDFSDDGIGPWARSQKLTSDGTIVAVETPGHVPGHISLIVYGEDTDRERTTYFLPGDATYGLDLLDKEEPDGINDDPMTALQSLKLIKQFAGEQAVVVLPSHDPDVREILENRQVYRPKA